MSKKLFRLMYSLLAVGYIVSSRPGQASKSKSSSKGSTSSTGGGKSTSFEKAVVSSRQRAETIIAARKAGKSAAEINVQLAAQAKAAAAAEAQSHIPVAPVPATAANKGAYPIQAAVDEGAEALNRLESSQGKNLNITLRDIANIQAYTTAVKYGDIKTKDLTPSQAKTLAYSSTAQQMLGKSKTQEVEKRYLGSLAAAGKGFKTVAPGTPAEALDVQAITGVVNTLGVTEYPEANWVTIDGKSYAGAAAGAKLQEMLYSKSPVRQEQAKYIIRELEAGRNPTTENRVQRDIYRSLSGRTPYGEVEVTVGADKYKFDNIVAAKRFAENVGRPTAIQQKEIERLAREGSPLELRVSGFEVVGGRPTTLLTPEQAGVPVVIKQEPGTMYMQPKSYVIPAAGFTMEKPELAAAGGIATVPQPEPQEGMFSPLSWIGFGAATRVLEQKAGQIFTTPSGQKGAIAGLKAIFNVGAAKRFGKSIFSKAGLGGAVTGAVGYLGYELGRKAGGYGGEKFAGAVRALADITPDVSVYVPLRGEVGAKQLIREQQTPIGVPGYSLYWAKEEFWKRALENYGVPKGEIQKSLEAERATLAQPGNVLEQATKTAGGEAVGLYLGGESMYAAGKALDIMPSVPGMAKEVAKVASKGGTIKIQTKPYEATAFVREGGKFAVGKVELTPEGIVKTTPYLKVDTSAIKVKTGMASTQIPKPKAKILETVYEPFTGTYMRPTEALTYPASRGLAKATSSLQRVRGNVVVAGSRVFNALANVMPNVPARIDLVPAVQPASVGLSRYVPRGDLMEYSGKLTLRREGKLSVPKPKITEKGLQEIYPPVKPVKDIMVLPKNKIELRPKFDITTPKVDTSLIKVSEKNKVEIRPRKEIETIKEKEKVSERGRRGGGGEVPLPLPIDVLPPIIPIIGGGGAGVGGSFGKGSRYAEFVNPILGGKEALKLLGFKPGKLTQKGRPKLLTGLKIQKPKMKKTRRTPSKGVKKRRPSMHWSW